MNKIVVSLYDGKVEGLNYENNSEFEYSVEKRNEIVDAILAANCAVVLKPLGQTLIIYVDQYKSFP